MRSFSYYGERGNLNDQELANVSTNDFRDVYEENRTVKYLYDDNGNQFADFNKDIAWIKYNLLNLPQTIQFANGNKTEYMYDAAGIKQSARWSYSTTEANIQLGDVTNENNSIGTTSTTDYCGAYVYEQGKLRRILTPEGYVSANGVITPNAIAYWQHVYLLKDHLGNTRKTMRSNFLSSTSVTLTDFSQAIDYYPFGMEITKVDNADSERYYSYMGGGAIPYLYNGKEMDRMHGLNSYDHGARWRDGVIPAWPAVDPLAEKYYSFSPYVYCGNNPVNAVDPDGMDWFQNNQTGAVVYVSNLHQGAEKGMEKGWEWMGANDMFMSDKDDYKNSDLSLAMKNGGHIEKHENNPLTKADDKVVTSMLLEGGKATKFMSDRGYEFKPTQQIRDEFEYSISMDHELGKNSTYLTSGIYGSQTFITEKSGYVPKGSIESGTIPTSPDNLLYLNNHTVNRFQITYTTNVVKKALNSLMPYIGYHDFRTPTIYSSPSEYPWNNKYINIFLRTRK